MRSLFGLSKIMSQFRFRRSNTRSPESLNAMIKALNALLEMDTADTLILGDSRLVVNQVNGLWKVTAKNLLPFYEEASKLFNKLANAKLRWWPEDQSPLSPTPFPGASNRVGHIAIFEDLGPAMLFYVCCLHDIARRCSVGLGISGEGLKARCDNLLTALLAKTNGGIS